MLTAQFRIGYFVRSPELVADLEASARQLGIEFRFRSSDPAMVRADQPPVDAVLLEMALARDAAPEVIARIKATYGTPLVVAVHTTAEAGEILGAMRAGAREFLHPPIVDGFRAVLQRLASECEASRARRTGHMAGFLSVKGGCGATTIARHVAADLAESGENRVLLADLDLTCGTIRFLTGATSEYSILDAMENLHRLDQAFWGGLVTHGGPRLHILPAPETTAGPEQLPVAAIADVLRFMGENYNWAVLDLGRGLTSIAAAALPELDELYLVATLQLSAMYHARQTINSLVHQGFSRERIRLLFNAVPDKPPFKAAELKQMIGHPPYALLPHDAAVGQAVGKGALMPDRNRFRKELLALSRKVGGVPEPVQSRSTLFGFHLS